MTTPALRAHNSTVREAQWPQDRGAVEDLVREYVSAVGVDISFQNVDEELRALPGRYARPLGCVLLACAETGPAGVVARRTIGPGVCEMKRLYVRPQFRGRGLARMLAEEVIGDARRAGRTRLHGRRPHFVSRSRISSGRSLLR